MSYTQLTYENYIQIQAYLKITHKQTLIAGYIGHNKSTISRLLKPFKNQYELFDAEIARSNRKAKRNNANQLFHKIIDGSDVANKIIDKIKLYNSPEQVSLRYKIEYNEYISPQTIYDYIYEYHSDLVKEYFRRKGKKYKHSKADNIKIPNRKIIDTRPEIVNLNTEIGHYEGDTIIGAKRTERILTIVDRKTNIFFAKLVLVDEYEKVSSAISRLGIEIFNKLPKNKVKTLTFDNGTEFADHEHITLHTGIDIYFAHPYHARERGANENMNGLLRQFLPKGSSFANLTQEKLDYYVDLINNRYRKKLKGKTPNEVFHSE